MTDRPFNMLFHCNGNSAHSIMAECTLHRWGGDKVRSFSAGSQPKGAVHPMTLNVLGKLNYDIRDLRWKSWDEFTAPDAPQLDFVFTVRDNAAAEVCPVWRPASR
jgi:protein-tyrosine-phosphatase